MRRLFCYTLSARAIGATVSAGALHAQGWGFESLIAHHLIEKAPSDGGLSFLGPVQRDSNPQGCGAEETRKRFPAQHARSGATKRDAGGASRTRTSLIVHHLIEKAPSDGGLSFLHTAYPSHGKSIAKRAPVRPIVRRPARDGLEPVPNCYA